jgi:hypothetical protein
MPIDPESMANPPIPVPAVTGVAGTQSGLPPSEAAEPDPAPFEELPLVTTLAGISTSNPKAFGPEVTTSLLRGSFQHIAHDLHATRAELTQVRLEMKTMERELSAEKVKTARLDQQLQGEVGSRFLKTTGVGVGAALIGYGINQIETPSVLTYVLLGVGVALVMIFGSLADVIRAMRGRSK